MLENIVDGKSTLFEVMAWCVRQQIIAWANVNPVLYRQMASLGQSELKQVIHGKVQLFSIHSYGLIA